MIVPAHTAFILIFGAKSKLKDFVICPKAPLVSPYAKLFGFSTKHWSEALITILPPSFSYEEWRSSWCLHSHKYWFE